MARLTPPALPPGHLQNLNTALHELHQRAGRLSVRELARSLGDGVASHSRIHDAFTKPRLPSWGLVELLVEDLACRIRGANPEEERDRFYQLWLAADGIVSIPEKSFDPLGGDPQEVIREITVKVFSKSVDGEISHGCGFLIRDSTIVTVDYLVNSSTEIWVRSNKNEDFHKAYTDSVEIEASSRGSNPVRLAVLRVYSPMLARSISLAAKPPRLGSRLITASFTAGETPSLDLRLSELVGMVGDNPGVRVDGDFENLESYNIAGAPVVDLSTGCLVGLVSRRNRDGRFFELTSAARIAKLFFSE